ncbi:MAG: hypothetical protein KGI49_01885 [Patescibacteria group bacterium]|nr:hypothetical protein [Patescibacteria group bacterium]
MNSKGYKLPKKIHIIGICGVATSALAMAFHRAGVRVTGSDKGFFPPVSTELERAGVSFYAGWHPEKMVADGKPDLVIITTASGTQNPETIYARDHDIPSIGYTEAFGRYFIKRRSIVVAGTWGKTSSTALLSYILIKAGMNPSYMFGAISQSHEAAAAITDGGWSVFEGDEYKSSPTDETAKFFYYKPTHLMLTAVSWDHADLYPAEKDYFDTFERLIATMPEDGLIVANKDNPGVNATLKGTNKKVVWYGKDHADYRYDNVDQSKAGLDFTVDHNGKSYAVKSPMLGAFQAENITGCFAMAHEIGIEPDVIVSAIASFKGMKRRLEKRLEGGITVFDDIAHSPEKAAAVLRELRSIYDGKIIAVFEPNRGGRFRDAASKYDSAFKDADAVFIPRLTSQKKSANESEEPIEGDELAAIISKTHKTCSYIDDDAELVEVLVGRAKKGDIIVFLGSHGFRGMIEATTAKLT